MTGQPTSGKLISLAQLQTELAAAGIDVSAGLGMSDELVYTYRDAHPSDFPANQESTVDTVIAAHVAMRNKTGVEYAQEFQDPHTNPERKQQIRDIVAGLLPGELVPMTEADQYHPTAR